MTIKDNILELLAMLVIFNAKIVADILITLKLVSWTYGHSGIVQSSKLLNALAERGVIEKCNGPNGIYYRMPGCRSEFKDHSVKLSLAIAEVLKSPFSPIVHREVSFKCVGLRADAAVLLRHGNKRKAFILEIVNTEQPNYLRMKSDEYLRYGPSKLLTELFGVDIPYVAFCVEGRDVSWANTLTEVLE